VDVEAPEVKSGVLVVDDHPLLRRLVRAACEDLPGVEVVGECGNGRTALEEAARVAPAIVVVDLILPDMDGLDLARRLRGGTASPRILVFTAREDPDAILGAMRAGADGFVGKSARLDEVRDAIRTVVGGGRAFSREQEEVARRHLVTRVPQAAEASRLAEALTPRQREVLEMIAEGASTRDMAARLELSERSVRSHATALYRKLAVTNRVEALRRAVELGLVRPPRL
jgi:DNA-binding NarL/FixJ family response regulator